MKFGYGLACLGLMGCTTVEVQFQTPRPNSDVAGLEKQAKEGYAYFAPNKFLLLVAPVGSIVDDGASSKTSADGASMQPPNKSASSPAGPAPKAAEPKTAAHSASSPSAEASRLEKAMIDGKPWAAVVTQVPDHARALMVKGHSGFWSKTTLKLTKVPNSDRVTSVSVAAENLFPKRLEQLSGILGSVIKIGASVDDRKTVLQPFTIELPEKSMAKPKLIQPGWFYQIVYPDEAQFRGVVTFAQFQDLSKDRNVNFWPVPACRAAELIVSQDQSEYRFYVTVAQSDALRLEPLPVAGSIQLGDLCSASTTVTATTDPFADVVANVAAVEKLVKTVKSLKAEDKDAK